MKYILLLGAFLALLGLAALVARLLQIYIGEAMILAVAVIDGGMLLAGFAGNYRAGARTLMVLGLLGLAYALIRRMMDHPGKTMMTPYSVILVLLFLGSIVIYFGDFIQHIDELHQWAFAVKRMLERNELPMGDTMLDPRQFYGTSFFHTYFQSVTGYQEAFMYVSAALLSGIGLLSPFARADRKQFKRALLYFITGYVSLYTLYFYGSKNLYVDLATALWAGGLACWWMNRDRSRKHVNRLLAVVGMLMIFFFKIYVGMVMDMLLLFFFYLSAQEEKDCRSKLSTTILKSLGMICGIGVAGVAVLLAVPSTRATLQQVLQTAGEILHSYKPKGVINAFAVATAGRPLSSYPEIKVTFVAMMALVFGLMYAWGNFSGNKRKANLMMAFTAIGSVMYLGILIFAELFVFGYDEAVKGAGLARYLSIPVLFFFMMTLNLLLNHTEEKKFKQYSRWIMLGLLFFFMLSFNTQFVANNTALGSTNIVAYQDIKATQKQLKNIQKRINAEDRVYMLNQDGANEFSVNMALYYLEEQSSSYLAEPWKFTEEGSIIRISENEDVQLSNLPDYLTGGGYTYLWVYKSNKYLKKNLPNVLNCEDSIEDGTLFRCTRNEEGRVTRLTWVCDLMNDD